MPIHRPIVRLAAACWLISTALAAAAPAALIVLGTAGSSSIAANLATTAQTVRDALVQRGFAAGSIEIIGAPPDNGTITRDLLLSALKKRETLTASDELWIVLLGFSGRDSDDAPAFQVRGPRLTANDLKTALDAIPARQFVFIGTSDSGAFIPILLKTGRDVLAATREEGEIDLPRFPENWAAALKEKPDAGWKELAARASVLTDQAYAGNGLAEGEHARLGDPATGRVLEAPFGVDATAPPAEKPSSDGSMALINASDIKVEIRKPNAEWEKQPATDETKKLIAEAQAAPNPDGFASILLEQRLGYAVGDDRTAEDFVLRRIYIEKEDGVAQWADFMLPQDPPAVTTKLEAARIIQPDGSSTVFNPAKMPPATDTSAGLDEPLTMVFIPGARAGCLIEIAYRTRHLLDAGLPDFSEELPVQIDVPVLKSELQLQVPPGNQVHFKLRNSDHQPVETTVDGLRTLTWKLDNLPAFEPLPYDPPERDLVVALDISSLNSWDDFAAWNRRLMRGSDEQDDAVKAKAEELAAGAATRLDKLRRAYEFVSALRYVAIEYGVNGIRPRSPAIVLQNRYGDCKDKANLLIALLGDMGIDARFTVLNRGSSTDTSFPSWQFNHAIAYVPKAPEAGQSDDLWLDTTDSTAPFPTLSPGDIGRNALVFDKDAARFRTVTAPGDDVTSITEAWKFERGNGGDELDGTLRIDWTGLGDYEARSSVRGASPRQRDFIWQSKLSRQLPDADFTRIDLSPADDLSRPMHLEAELTLPDNGRGPGPLPGFDLAAYFPAPQRDRPLLINNGQKLRLVQTVEISSGRGAATAADPPAFDQQVAGIHATISWQKDAAMAWTRTAALTIDQPLVAQADYIPVRRLLRDWAHHLSP